MADIACFVERYTVARAEELTALVNFKLAAHQLGHQLEYVFRKDLAKIPTYDALFIRSLTDPLNAAYVAARTAELHGMKVIDDPDSIIICCDKINMYMHLMKMNVSMPRTRFLKDKELDEGLASQLFEELGTPLVLKEPSTSFSARVEKVSSPDELLKVAKRFFKLSDWIVVQEYIESRFDWRVGVINGQLLYACRYIIPSETFKIQASVNGHIVYCDVESVPADQVPPGIIKLGREAGNAIGKGLYGVDIKESNGKLYVIEVNDNPSLEGGEDAHYPDMFQKIISYLMTGDACSYAEDLSEKALGPHGFEGEYGLGAAAGICSQPALEEKAAYSYKIDF